MTQGERVRDVRKSLKLTLEKFGEKLGVGKTAISKIEKGENTLTDQMMRAICREYNVSYDYLMYGEGEMFDDLPQTIMDELCRQHNLDSFDRILLEMYIGFSEAERSCIKSKIYDMIGKIEKLKATDESSEE